MPASRPSTPAPRPSTPDASAAVAGLVPPPVHAILDRLWSAGHAAYVVGGSLRDALLDETPQDWDVTTDARPERIQALFPGSHYENRFGTVLVPAGAGHVVEVTTFRRDHRYRDHRRPDDVTFGDDLAGDLVRRDFTVNALAWGRPARPARPALVDVSGGIDDLRTGVLRAVGDPLERFDEDALRLMRGARLAAQLGFRLDPATEAGMRRAAGLVRHVSQERIGQELRKMLHAREPSRGLRIMADTGILDGAVPELAEQRGVPQAKVPGMDCWEHTLWTVDAARRLRPDDEGLALAALFHDAGKPRTMNGGHFIGHENAGADIAERVLRRLAVPGKEISRITHLIRHHMFNYEPSWSDAAVRRLVQRVGPDALDDLLALREADNLGSGQHADQGHLIELRRRITEQQAQGFPLTLGDLAVDGNDLRRELGLPPGPVVGALLERLLDAATGDPARNTYRQAILDARVWLPEVTQRVSARTRGRAASGERPSRERRSRVCGLDDGDPDGVRGGGADARA